MHADEQPHKNQAKRIEEIMAEPEMNQMSAYQPPDFGIQDRHAIVLQPVAPTVTEKLEYAADNDQYGGKPPAGNTPQNCLARMIVILV